MSKSKTGNLRVKELEDSVRQVTLFASLPPEEIQSLVASLHYCEYPGDAILFHEGDPGDRLSILLEGQIEVLKDMGTPDERRVNLFGPGDFLGEMSLFYRDGVRSQKCWEYLKWALRIQIEQGGHLAQFCLCF